MKMYLAIIAAACMYTVSATELFDAEKQSDFSNGNNLTVEKNIFSYMGNQTFSSAKKFPVDPAKKYKISIKIRCIGGQLPMCYIGFIPFDAKNNVISHNMIDGQSATVSVLAAPLKKGDQFAKLIDAAKWDAKTSYGYIAFNAKPNYSDLPNRELMKMEANGISRKGNVWHVYLAGPATKDYPKGTIVRQHLDGTKYIYAKVVKLNNNWMEIEGYISGIQNQGYTNTAFWAGTKTVCAMLMTSQGDQRTKIEFKDFELKEDK